MITIFPCNPLLMILPWIPSASTMIQCLHDAICYGNECIYKFYVFCLALEIACNNNYNYFTTLGIMLLNLSKLVSEAPGP